MPGARGHTAPSPKKKFGGMKMSPQLQQQLHQAALEHMKKKRKSSPLSTFARKPEPNVIKPSRPGYRRQQSY